MEVKHVKVKLSTVSYFYKNISNFLFCESREAGGILVASRDGLFAHMSPFY